MPAALDVLPFANAKTITPLGQSREMQPKDLAGLDIGYRYDGHTMVARTIKTSAYYPVGGETCRPWRSRSEN